MCDLQEPGELGERGNEDADEAGDATDEKLFLADRGPEFLTSTRADIHFSFNWFR